MYTDEVLEQIKHKLLNGIDLTQEELEDIAYYSGDWEQEYGSGRWAIHVRTVLDVGNGRVFALDWERGSTERQEDVIEYQPYEVEIQEEWVKIKKVVPIEQKNN